MAFEKASIAFRDKANTTVSLFEMNPHEDKGSNSVRMARRVELMKEKKVPRTQIPLYTVFLIGGQLTKSLKTSEAQLYERVLHARERFGLLNIHLNHNRGLLPPAGLLQRSEPALLRTGAVPTHMLPCSHMSTLSPGVSHVFRWHVPVH